MGRRPRPAAGGAPQRLSAAIDARGGLGGVAAHPRPPRPRRGGPAAARALPGAARGRARRGRHLTQRTTCASARSRRSPRRGTPPTTSRWSADGACFTGDAVLGEGSVFISPYHGAMAGYLLALDAPAHARRLQRAVPRARAARMGCARQARGVRRPPHRPREPADRGAGRRPTDDSRSCWTRSGPRCRSRCARSPPPRSPRIWTSSKTSRSCPRASSARGSNGPSGERPPTTWRLGGAPSRTPARAPPRSTRRSRRSPTTASSRTATPARSSPPTARSSGCACRTSTRRRCSARCSTAAPAAGAWAPTGSTSPPAGATSPART